MFTIHNGGVLDSVPEDRPLAQPHDPLLSTAGPSSNHHPHHHPHHPHHHHSNTLPNSISGVGAEHHQHAHHQHPHHQHAHYNHHPAQHYTPGSSASLGRGSRGANPAMSEAELEVRPRQNGRVNSILPLHGTVDVSQRNSALVDKYFFYLFLLIVIP